MEERFKVENFKNKRIKAERLASARKNGGEITLEEIYQCFEGITDAEAAELAANELEMELSVCMPNNKILDFYSECIKHKKVILISDMYLNSDMLRKILDSCGIYGYEKLYVSCEAGASKRNGGLYRYVMRDLKISSSDLLHIGNDFMSDYIGARRNNIYTMKIQTEHDHIKSYDNNRVLEINVDDQNSGGVFSLVKNVIINNKSEVQIDIAAIEAFENKENISLLNSFGCRVFQIGAQRNKLIKQIIVFINLKKLIKKEGYKCVHIHADTANKLLISGSAARFSGVKKIILHSHSSGIDSENRNIKYLVHKICRRFLKYIGTDFVSCSDYASKWMFPNIRQENISIINNGIDLDKFRFNNDIRLRRRSELGLTDELLIGHVGGFSYVKNHEYLIKIINDVIKQNQKVRLLLVGTGHLKDKICQQVNDLGIQNYVIFYGVSDKVNELMSAMDAFVLPSHFEGFPIVGVETQASGLPVVFSDAITPNADITGESVFLPIEDRTVSMWTDTLLNSKKSEAERLNAYDILKTKKYDIADTVNSFVKLYGSRA